MQTCGRSKEHEHGLGKVLKVIVPMDGRFVGDHDLAEHLHTDDGVDEKEHDYEKGYVRQCLEGLDKSPEKGADALAPTQQFHQSHNAE